MRRLFLALPLLLLAACDSGEPGPPDRPEAGRFDAEVRGSLTRDLSGNAGFLVQPTSEGSSLFVALTARGASGRFIAIADPNKVIATAGTYAVGELGGREGLSVTYFDASGDADRILSAVSGTVQVTAAGPDRIEGTVSARLVAGFRDDGPASMLTAEFRAVHTPLADGLAAR